MSWFFLLQGGVWNPAFLHAYTWDGFGANLGKRREQGGFPEKRRGCQVPKCQSVLWCQEVLGEIRRDRAEEQSGDDCVARGTEQQQSKELENKEHNKEKAKASTAQLSRSLAHGARNGSLGQPAGKPAGINFSCVVGFLALWQLHTSAAWFPPLFIQEFCWIEATSGKSLIAGKHVCFLGKLEQAHVLVLPLVNQKQAAGCLVGLHRCKTGSRRRRLGACCRRMTGNPPTTDAPRTCAVPFTLSCQQLPPACPCPCTAPLFTVITLISA